MLMTISSRTLASRLVASAAVIAAIATASLTSAGSARANENFTLTSQTGVVFTSLNTVDLDPTCTGGYANGLFGYKYPGLFPSSYVGMGLTGTASVSGCSSAWYFASEVGVLDGTLSPLDITGGQGFFSFAAAWLPEQDLALTQCFMGNPETAAAYGITPLADFMTVAVDGNNCTAAWLPGVTALPKSRDGVSIRMAPSKSDHLHTRLISSVANVGKRTVRVPIQIFGGPEALERAVRVTEKITLTDRTGRVIAVGKVRVPVGKPVTVRIPLVKQRADMGNSALTVSMITERRSAHQGTGHQVDELTLNFGRHIALAHESTRL
jgi:hypothetical protein